MQWYIKEFSTLTKVSVRMLRHYDKAGLLKPSIRLLNSYRQYCEKDMLKLQQIIVLKSFGFSLKDIKSFSQDALNNLLWQKSVLLKKQKQVRNALITLDKVIDDFKNDQHVD